MDRVVRTLELTDSEVAFYHRDGYLPLPGFLAADAADALREEVLDVLDANGAPRASLKSATGAVHGSGTNHSAEPRVAYAQQYDRDDVRWYDATSDTWKLLVDERRSATSPVARLG